MSQQLTIIRYTTHPQSADENHRLVERVFAELADGGDDVEYTVLRLDDAVTFMHLVITEGTANPLLELAAFKHFQQDLAQRIVPGSLSRSAATLVGNHSPFSRTSGRHDRSR